MGPNLKRLFGQVKRTRAELSALEEQQLYLSKQSLYALFSVHGEALIEALEGVLDESEEYTKNHVAAAKLLAQLESEAQR